MRLPIESGTGDKCIAVVIIIAENTGEIGEKVPTEESIPANGRRRIAPRIA